MRRRLSRRDFLKFLRVLAGAGLVSACTRDETPSTPNLTKPPTPSPTPSATPTPTPYPVPPPQPVGTNFDVSAIYLHGRGLYSEGIEGQTERMGYGTVTVEPLYGEVQTPLTMTMDIKWAREHGITTFVMPTAYPDTFWEKVRLEEWFLAINKPPFEIDYALMFNPEPYIFSPLREVSPYPLETGVVKIVKELLLRHVDHPRYKRLPDGRPVVFFYFAHIIAWFLGLDKLEETVDLLRGSFNEDIFLVGDVMQNTNVVKTSSEYQSPGFISRQVKPFDAISSYYMWRAGYVWNNQEEWNTVVTPFTDMVAGYQEACELWGEEADKLGVKLIAPIAPTGVSNRVLYEAGLDEWLVDRHEGVSYETSKAMAEVGAEYADSDLKMVHVGAWNECSEGAAIVPSKQFGFDPIHAVRDTFAIEPAGGWPQDYYPSS